MVKCADCGYLGKRWGSWNQNFIEASREERQAGLRDHHEDVQPGDLLGAGRHASPACYRNSFAFPSVKSGPPGLIQIDSQHSCTYFFGWIPFWTAEQHLREQRMELLEQQRRDWEERQEVSRRAWEERAVEQQAAFDRALNRQSNRVTIVVGVIAAALVTAQILTAVLFQGDVTVNLR